MAIILVCYILSCYKGNRNCDYYFVNNGNLLSEEAHVFIIVFGPLEDL